MVRKAEFNNELRQFYISSYYYQLDIVKSLEKIINQYENELKAVQIDKNRIIKYHKYLVIFKRFIPQIESVEFNEDDFIGNDKIVEFKEDWQSAIDDLKSLKVKCDREIAKAYFDLENISDMDYHYIKKAYKLVDQYLASLIEAYRLIQQILAKQNIKRPTRPKKQPKTIKKRRTKKSKLSKVGLEDTSNDK